MRRFVYPFMIFVASHVILIAVALQTYAHGG